jgi:dCMP deaminase
MRVSKVDYYLGIARAVSDHSPCSRKKFGAIIVKDDRVISSGYNGTIRGAINCGIDVPCIKDCAKEPSLISYEYCPAIHAEQNAILHSDPIARMGGTMYIASSNSKEGDRPCFMCRRFIVQSGLCDVYYIDKGGVLQHESVSSYVNMENKWMKDTLDKADPTWRNHIP